ncbi:MAG: DnaA N-terminal domain-containing protein, partial [Kiloniellales bacterium]
MAGREPEDFIAAQWARVRGRLRSEFGDAAFGSWLKPMTLADVRKGAVRIAVPTRFMRDWVAAHYGERIRALWAEEDPAIRAVDIIVDPNRSSAGAGGAVPAAEVADDEDG